MNFGNIKQQVKKYEHVQWTTFKKMRLFSDFFGRRQQKYLLLTLNVKHSVTVLSTLLTYTSYIHMWIIHMQFVRTSVEYMASLLHISSYVTLTPLHRMSVTDVSECHFHSFVTGIQGVTFSYASGLRSVTSTQPLHHFDTVTFICASVEYMVSLIRIIRYDTLTPFHRTSVMDIPESLSFVCQWIT